jgi:hypothetical protein
MICSASPDGGRPRDSLGFFGGEGGIPPTARLTAWHGLSTPQIQVYY